MDQALTAAMTQPGPWGEAYGGYYIRPRSIDPCPIPQEGPAIFDRSQVVGTSRPPQRAEG
jgi:hypothetical protein